MSNKNKKLKLVKLRTDLSFTERIVVTVAGLVPDKIYSIKDVRETSLGELYTLTGTYQHRDGIKASTVKFRNISADHVVQFVPPAPKTPAPKTIKPPKPPVHDPTHNPATDGPAAEDFEDYHYED